MKTIERSISLIVPALNEQNVVGSVLRAIYAEVSPRFSVFEIITVNDGSSDATGQIMEDFSRSHGNVVVIHNHKNIGLGASFQKGLSQARHDYVMLLCGDGGLPALSLPKIFEQIGTADLVIPYMTNLKKIKSNTRYFLSRGYSNLLNFFFGFHLHYYNGLPIYPRLLLQEIDITSTGFGFQGEVLVKLLKSGCTFVEVGVEGAEETGRSFALRPKNLFSVAKTFLHLVVEIIRFKPIPSEVISRSRVSNSSPANLSINL
ncbi:MAG: glycosyltransferase family 2 protein [Actinobacteria bacterium]|nr:glycosyltransferase family 2 protein [Actinomycetota bacterium]